MLRKEAVEIFLIRCEQAYIEDQRAKGIVASGASAQSLRPANVLPTGGQLIGHLYIGAQKYGRRPGKFPPIEAIIQWLKDKRNFRIDEERGPSLKSLAFLIARKIAKSGTDIYQKKRPALSIEEKLLEARRELAKNLASITKQDFIDTAKTAHRS
jgi:hypothetical protein